MKRFLIGALLALVCGAVAAQAATPAPVTGTVKWTAPTTDVSGNPVVVTSYNIYAGTTTTTCSSATPLTKVGSTAGGVTTFTETGVIPGTTICIAVTAVNSAAAPPESGYSNIFSYTPSLPTPPTPPTPPPPGTPSPPTNVIMTIIVTPAPATS